MIGDIGESSAGFRVVHFPASVICHRGIRYPVKQSSGHPTLLGLGVTFKDVQGEAISSATVRMGGKTRSSVTLASGWLVFRSLTRRKQCERSYRLKMWPTFIGARPHDLKKK